MRNAAIAVLVGAAGLCVGGTAHADVALDALGTLRGRYPGVLVQEGPVGSARILYGRPMNDGASPAQASNDFVNAHRGVFGNDGATLGVRERGEGNAGALHNFVYAQTMDGLRVEHAFVSVVVRTMAAAGGPDPLVHAVVMAQGVVAQAPAGGFAPDVLTAEDAQNVVRAAGYGFLKDWHEADLVVYFDPEHPEVPAVRAWKFHAADINGEKPRAFTFFVDAATGALVHVRNDIHHADVTGSVVGLVTPPNRPDVPTNLPVQQPIGGVKVEVVGTNPLVFVFTQQDGTFTIPNMGTDPVTLRVSAGGGRWSAVTNNNGAALSVTQGATPGTPVQINLLPTSTAATQSQLNALVYADQTHNFIRDRVTISGLDTALATNVNEGSTCNAFYQQGPPDSIHFFAAGGGCVNTAYASVVNHEYGHFIVNERGLGQGAFGEGYADVMSVLINDDPIIGREFGTAAMFPPVGAIRHIDGSGSETLPNYPCNGEVHYCGEVLANISWNIRNNMNTRYGAPMGLDLTRDLIADWSVIMTGGEVPSSGENSAHAGTAVQMLTVDDVDGNTSNGTPNFAQIRPAFLARNISVPCVDARVEIQPQATIPAVITTGSQPLTVPVTISAGTASVISGTAAVKWRAAGSSDPYESIPMTPTGVPGVYTAHFPTLSCGQAIQYYYSVQTSEQYQQTTELTLPSHTCGDASSAFSTQATDASTSFSETFEVDTGAWTRTIAGGGSWVRSSFSNGYVATGANPTTDTTPAPGVFAWTTGNDFNSTNANAGDLDGTSILTSPAYDLSNAAGAIISYQRWVYMNNDGAGDEFRAEVSVDNGATWHVGERLVDTAGAAWVQGGFSLGALGLTPSATTRVRFVGVDALVGTQTTFEAGIDDVTFATLTCNTGPTCDSIDFNGDTLFPDTADIGDFLTVFGGGTCPTGTCGDIDFNNDGLFPDTDDITALLRVFAGGSC